MVLGVEANWDWTNISGSRAYNLGPSTTSVSLADLGSVRGRVGYTWGKALLYGTGGWAWSASASATCPQGCSSEVSDTHALNGYVVGGGVEYGVTPNLSLKAEYLYTHLSPVDYFTGGGCPTHCSIGADVNSFLLGANFLFGGSS